MLDISVRLLLKLSRISAIAIAVATLLHCNSTISGQTLHAILVADTDDANIGNSVSADLLNIRDTLKNGLPDGHLRIIVLDGRMVTADRIIQELRTVKIVPDVDPVLFYFSGHGGFSENQGHYLALTHGRNLRRSELEEAITRPELPKFWAIITDCCASGEQNVGVPTAMATSPNRQLLKGLFLSQTGRLDITSSRPSQVSVGDGSGGVFTTAFCNVLQANAGQQLNWLQVFEKTRTMASERYEEGIARRDPRDLYSHSGVPQRTQTAYSFKTMYSMDPNGNRLGIGVSGRDVIRVDPNTPASNAGLQVGMTILQVNGQNISDENQLITAVNFSQRDAIITALTGRGQVNFRIRLKY